MSLYDGTSMLSLEQCRFEDCSQFLIVICALNVVDIPNVVEKNSSPHY